MDTAFAAEVAEWHEFYAAIAGAAATLVGLVFVSLALNPSVMRDDGPTGMRIWAAQTFHNFLVVLAIALVTLIPDADPLTLGIVLAILAGQGLVRVVSDIRQAARDADPTWHGRRAVARFAMPAAAYLLCLWAAVLAFRENEAALGWLIAVIFLLVFSASSSCWDLLKEIGTHSDGR